MKKLIVLTILLSLVACGKQGSAGKNGVSIKGDKGEQGEVGASGRDGQDTSPTRVLKLCSGLTDVYGVSYQEQGLCIEGKTYAIYSASNTAALVELSPGAYSTTTPQGTNCTFVVAEDCTITNP